MNSQADTVMFPVQDILGLGQENRMNQPGIAQNNWKWRLLKKQMDEEILQKMADLVDKSNRCSKLHADSPDFI